MNHAKDIIEKTINIRSQKKVISIIQNNYFNGEEIPFHQIVKFLKPNIIHFFTLFDLYTNNYLSKH